MRCVACRTFETPSHDLSAIETKPAHAPRRRDLTLFLSDAFFAAVLARLAGGLRCDSGGFHLHVRTTFQAKFGCVVLAVLCCGAASTAFVQSSAYSGSGSSSNSSGAHKSDAGGSNSSSSSGTNDASATSTGARKIRSKVAPEYPALARQVNVTGKVKISVTISPEGRVVNTKVLGGSPLLTEAANTAVKQWRYEPAAKESTEIVEVDFSGH
jgi:TonB family protein